jgi:hypothetical protein
MMYKEAMKKTSIYMDADVHRLLKSGAARHGVRLGQVVAALCLLHSDEIAGPGNKRMDKAINAILESERRGQNLFGMRRAVVPMQFEVSDDE